MRTGLTKRQKTTEIFFDETKSRITVYTHNTDLKKRLTAFAGQHPDHCIMTDEDTETGYKAFEIEKGRLSFRLTAPYSEERRQAASEVARCNPLQFRKNCNFQTTNFLKLLSKPENLCYNLLCIFIS